MKTNLKIRKELLLLLSVVFLMSCLTNVAEEEIEEQVGGEPIETVVVSFKDAVQPIINAKCTSCHSPSGGQSPNLTSYDEVNAKSARVKARVDAGTMPPSGPLPSAQVNLILDWVNEGALNN